MIIGSIFDHDQVRLILIIHNNVGFNTIIMLCLQYIDPPEWEIITESPVLANIQFGLVADC